VNRRQSGGYAFDALLRIVVNKSMGTVRNVIVFAIVELGFRFIERWCPVRRLRCERALLRSGA